MGGGCGSSLPLQLPVSCILFDSHTPTPPGPAPPLPGGAAPPPGPSAPPWLAWCGSQCRLLTLIYSLLLKTPRNKQTSTPTPNLKQTNKPRGKGRSSSSVKPWLTLAGQDEPPTAGPWRLAPARRPEDSAPVGGSPRQGGGPPCIPSRRRQVSLRTSAGVSTRRSALACRRRVHRRGLELLLRLLSAAALPQLV